MTPRCVICGLNGSGRDWPRRERYLALVCVTCPRCGDYLISSTQGAAIEKRIQEQGAPEVFAEWVYEQNRSGSEPPLLESSDVPRIAARRRLTFADRVQRLLIYLLEQTNGHPGRDVDLGAYKVQAALQTFDENYIGHVSNYLKTEEVAEISLPQPSRGRSRTPVKLTAKGVMRAEELVRTYGSSTQGFVAMWFSPELGDAWGSGFEVAITASGYVPRRIDKKEHANKIDDEIIAEIRKSRFVVADFTGQRGGVYFEAGFALGRDIPVIWTCRKDELTNLHFDIRQYNCIDWETPEDLARRLQARIEALIGVGPQKQLG